MQKHLFSRHIQKDYSRYMDRVACVAAGMTCAEKRTMSVVPGREPKILVGYIVPMCVPYLCDGYFHSCNM